MRSNESAECHLTAARLVSYVVRQYMAPHTDVKRGSAELMVLAAIERRSRHGYEIAKLIDEHSDGVLRFHVASLYPMLYRMERRGWIEGKWIEKAGQRRRRYYRITVDGRKTLAAQRNTWRELLTALQRVAGLEISR
jgi:PadR family transcriptional regulator, regulatory protein PadR